MQRLDFRAILASFHAHGVDFVVVGGVAAVLQGAPVSTFDLDIVHARTPENVDRLVAALRELDAHYRERPELRLCPDPGRLLGPGHHRLLTRGGPLDLLGVVATGEGYPELAAHSERLALDAAGVVQVLKLEHILAIKERLGRERDRAVLPVLRRTVNERASEHAPDPDPPEPNP